MAAAGTGGKIPSLADRMVTIEQRHASMARWAERVNERLRVLEEEAREGREQFIAYCAATAAAEAAAGES